MLTIEPRMVNLIWAHSIISFKNMPFWCPFLDSHLTAYCSSIGVHIIVMFDLGMSILKWYNTQCIIECLKSNHLHLTLENTRTLESKRVAQDKPVSEQNHVTCSWSLVASPHQNAQALTYCAPACVNYMSMRCIHPQAHVTCRNSYSK